MATLTLNDVNDIARRQRPWTIRLELVDFATNTQKFWYATGRGTKEAVETAWGRIGSKPQTKLVGFDKFIDKVNEKLGKGYTYAQTGFVRMSPENLAKLGGRKAVQGTPKQAAPAPTAPKPVPAPAAPAAPSNAFPPPMGTPKAGMPPLTGPYDLIVALKPVKDGFEALDDNKDVVMDLTVSGGQDLIQNYGIPVAWSL
jgi:predicted DNA-binding WGR domain protein